MKNRVAEYRKKYHLSQQQLAFKLNVSRQTVISIEKNRYSPSLPLAFDIAKIFNVTIEDVFIDERRN